MNEFNREYVTNCVMEMPSEAAMFRDVFTAGDVKAIKFHAANLRRWLDLAEQLVKDDLYRNA